MMQAEIEEQVNPNLAEMETLAHMPGVGKVLAQRIVQGRPYQSLEDLAGVSGIGPRLLDRIGPSLTFSSKPPQEEKPKATASTPRPVKARPPRQDANLVWMLVFSVGSVILSSGLTLAILLGINGTLNMGRHAQVRELGAEVSALGAELDGVDSSLQLVESRLSGLASLPGRMDGVESQLGEAQAQVEASQAKVAELQDRLARMEATMVQWQERADRFDRFIRGMRSLLDGLDPAADGGIQ